MEVASKDTTETVQNEVDLKNSEDISSCTTIKRKNGEEIVETALKKNKSIEDYDKGEELEMKMEEPEITEVNMEDYIFAQIQREDGKK